MSDQIEKVCKAMEIKPIRMPDFFGGYKESYPRGDSLLVKLEAAIWNHPQTIGIDILIRKNTVGVKIICSYKDCGIRSHVCEYFTDIRSGDLQEAELAAMLNACEKAFCEEAPDA